MNHTTTISFPVAALLGLRAVRASIDEQISRLESEPETRASAPTIAGDEPAQRHSHGGGSKPGRHMSAAARKRISQAQKRRWAAARRNR